MHTNIIYRPTYIHLYFHSRPLHTLYLIQIHIYSATDIIMICYGHQSMASTIENICAGQIPGSILLSDQLCLLLTFDKVQTPRVFFPVT